MSSIHLVDREILPLVERAPATDITDGTLAAVRAAMDAGAAAGRDAPLPSGVVELRLAIPGPAGAPPIQLLVLGPAAPSAASPEATPAILFVHGGGFVTGAPDRSRLELANLVLATGAVVVAPKYRLAPETRFPGAIEDCYTTLLWVHAEAATLRVDRTRIAVMGVSAGGGLAACLAILARDRGETPICAQVLNSPMLDDQTGGARDRGPLAGEFIWTARSNCFGWRSLLGPENLDGAASPYAAAARAEDLSGLPAACILVGALDLLLEEDLDYARRLARAGVPIDMRVYAGAVHTFSRLESATVSKAYVADLHAAFARAFARHR